jgi:glutaredoxin-dependent peroxiredoxin
LARLAENDTVVFGISLDSPAANAAFAKQIGVTFPLLSDMNREVSARYGIVQPFDKYASQGIKYDFVQRTTFVVDKQGVIQHIEQGGDAVNPNTAVTVCTRLGHHAGS